MVISHEHFKRAVADIAAHGDNDMLPFDVDNRFISDCAEDVAQIAYEYFESVQSDSIENSKRKTDALNVFNERLLSPTGASGFRTTTKIHPFWNVYFNGLGVGIAQRFHEQRDARAFSYRFLVDGGRELFDRDSSWRAFREATIAECSRAGRECIVTQTDISGFYEHISHHHIENLVNDLFPEEARIAKQVNALLSKFSSNRSFGLPVGGQCARILAELALVPVDQAMSEASINWFRYVDDYVLITKTHAEAYEALAHLSHTLANYGLTLNKTKTLMLNAKHYADYVQAQLGSGDDEASKLREIDVHFDPYSDTAVVDYEALRDTVETLEVQRLLNRELGKAQPDSFLVAQIGRTLRLQSPAIALQLCRTLLSESNLHAFRAAWATVMRGISKVRGGDEFSDIAQGIDLLLDSVPEHSEHLLKAEASLLHYLRTIRFAKTLKRGMFVSAVYRDTSSETVRRACIECWRAWGDRQAFTSLRNRMGSLGSEQQRLLWLAASAFGDEGDSFMRQNRQRIALFSDLGIERQNAKSFASTYMRWANGANHAA